MTADNEWVLDRNWIKFYVVKVFYEQMPRKFVRNEKKNCIKNKWLFRNWSDECG